MNKEIIITKIQAHRPNLLAETPASAAVLVILLHDEEENLSILVTKRPDHIATYPGHYCFPGGFREITDQDLQATVIREVEEELGIQSQFYNLIGQLDDFHDRYGNLVRTFFAVMSKEEFETKSHNSREEVETIFYFPLADLQKIEADKKLEQISHRHPMYRYEQDSVVIWGLTASILVHLSNILYMTGANLK